MDNRGFRTEKDSLGSVQVPAGSPYGAQTQRALDNFTLSKTTMRWEFIEAVIVIKKAAAKTHLSLGLLAPEIANAITEVCDKLIKKKDLNAFPVSVYQTGSGTSTNMNVNEVISHLAGTNNLNIHPNDHVNLGQSSNDVIPSAIHISTAASLSHTLLPAIDYLIKTIKNYAEDHREVIKTGRTHLMDAMPVRLSNELMAWVYQLEESKERFNDLLTRLVKLPLGGTAVGSGVNCPPGFPEKAIAGISDEISSITSLASPLLFKPMKSPYKGLSSLDTPLELSGHLKNLAMVLYKIANDLRWMNSGPGAGLGEITLPALQPGSSIMPAKVNPVIPEAVCMASAQVAGFDSANTLASQAGNFQLNTMFPLVANNLLEGISLITNSCMSLADKAISEMIVNKERCSEPLEKNPILVTGLVPEIGYQKAAEIGKIAASEKRTVLDVAREQTDIDEERLQILLNPERLADGGRKDHY